MQITFIRHGESVSNAARIWQGQSDAPLSPLGTRQAHALADRLAGDRTITRILSSDLRRAHDTARILGQALSMPVAPSQVWREIDLGAWEGLSRAEVNERYPEQVAALARGEDAPVGGAERWSDLGSRIGAAFAELLATGREDEHAVIVAHGGVIITLMSELLGVISDRPRVLGKLTNTSVTSLRVDEGGVTLLAYNDGLHVDDSASWRREIDERGRVVVALRADPAAEEAPGLDGLPAALAARAATMLELASRPESLRRWANSMLPGTQRAIPVVPRPGARCVTTAARPGGTLWTWNEGGAFPERR